MAVSAPPINIIATPGDEQVSVAFTPGPDNGTAVTAFTVTALDTTVTLNGGQTASGPASPITVTGLTNGDGYTFTVTATNASGVSVASDPSNLAIPVDAPADPPPDPYEDAENVPLTKEVNVVQLTDELSTALGQTVQVAIVHDDFSQPISVGNPAVLWIRPDTVNLTTVNNVIAAHVINPNYGIPATVAEFNAVTQAVITDYEIVLTADQIQTAIKGLLVRFNSIPSVPEPPSQNP